MAYFFSPRGRLWVKENPAIQKPFQPKNGIPLSCYERSKKLLLRPYIAHDDSFEGNRSHNPTGSSISGSARKQTWSRSIRLAGSPRTLGAQPFKERFDGVAQNVQPSPWSDSVVTSNRQHHTASTLQSRATAPADLDLGLCLGLCLLGYADRRTRVKSTHKNDGYERCGRTNPSCIFEVGGGAGD